MPNPYLIIGGDGAGMSAASKIKRALDNAEVIVFERGQDISYSACGMPYWIAGVIVLSIVLRFLVSEGGASTILLATFVCAATGAFVVLLTRRLLIAAVAMLAQVLLVSIASWIKLKYKNNRITNMTFLDSPSYF